MTFLARQIFTKKDTIDTASFHYVSPPSKSKPVIGIIKFKVTDGVCFEYINHAEKHAIEFILNNGVYIDGINEGIVAVRVASKRLPANKLIVNPVSILSIPDGIDTIYCNKAIPEGKAIVLYSGKCVFDAGLFFCSPDTDFGGYLHLIDNWQDYCRVVNLDQQNKI